MSLRLLEQITRGAYNWRLADLGTGSGILALAAVRLGAERVVALDNDPVAIKTARQNAALNRIRRVHFQLGDALRPGTKQRFHIIVANLFSELLIAGLPGWRRLLEPHGRLILSGILRRQEREVIAALTRNRYTVLTVRRRPKWIAILAVRRATCRVV
jgi:ribosomal protein L11 methyltransferase